MKNNYEIRGNIIAIIINSPKYGKIEALIDFSDFKKVDEFLNSWYVWYSKSTDSHYVFGKTCANNKQKTHCLHRWITDAPDGFVVDHKDFNGLNNVRENLRVCTELENAQNKKGACKNSKTGIRGVTWAEKAKKWKGTLQINRKVVHVGFFETIQDAEKAVKKARKEMMPYSSDARSDIA